MNIFMGLWNPMCALTIWRWVPSPQSNISISFPRLTMTLEERLFGVGMLPLVPRKVIFNYFTDGFVLGIFLFLWLLCIRCYMRLLVVCILCR